jgi:SPP1 gp7 family putative phage head morphogenesis protein
MARTTEGLKAKQVVYWNTRTRKRKVNQEKYTNKQIQELLKYYRESLRQLDRMVKETYDKYGSDTGLGITELIGVLTGVERKEFLNKVKERMEILGLVPEDVYNQKMLSRITRVEALKEQAYWEMRRLQAIQEIKTTSILNNTMEHSYDLIMKDYVGDDYKPGVFTRFNPGLPEQVLREKWSGKNYSKRVWGKERNKMAKELPVKIAGALISGQSYNRTAMEIRKEYNVMQWEAMRLVRTESAFVDGQSNKRAMLDVEIKQYTLDVTLDSRTSDICGDIDETEVFNYEDAVVGENFQPFHPNCRTVDQPLTSEESIQNAKETFNQRLEELEEEEEEEGVNYEEIYPSAFDSAYNFLMSKQGADKVPNGEWARGERGDFTLVMYETDSKVTLSAIGTREKGTGLGSELMEQLKEYMDFTHKLLVVEDVQNPKFFDKFDWLEAKESIKSYMYSPLDDKTVQEIMKGSPLAKEKGA